MRRKSMDNRVDEIQKHTHCGKDENTTQIGIHWVAMWRRKTMNRMGTQVKSIPIMESIRTLQELPTPV